MVADAEKYAAEGKSVEKRVCLGEIELTFYIRPLLLVDELVKERTAAKNGLESYAYRSALF